MMARDGRRPGFVVMLLAIGVAVAGFVGCLAVDRHVYQTFGPDLGAGRYVHDLWRRSGDLRVWLVVSGLVTGWELLRRWRGSGEPLRGPLLMGTVVAGAVLSELLKIAIRRGRPNLHDGLYVFRPYGDRPFDSGQLGLPSGEATIAFTGAWMLCFLYPRLSPLWLFFAVACSAARVASQRHFLSDTFAAMIVGFLVSWGILALVRRWIGRRSAGLATAA